jgi:hypothetical protein
VAGWYPDPWTTGILRYWTGQEWTAHTALGPQPAMYSAPTPSWPAPDSPWTNTYAAEASQQASRRTATIATLTIVVGILAIVVTAEASHYLTVRDATPPAALGGSANAPITAPIYAPPSNSPTSARLPTNIAGLLLNPQSPNMRHHLTDAAESELSGRISPVTIGYYETAAGSSKVFLETIDDSPIAGKSSPAVLLSRLEKDFDQGLSVPAGSKSRSVWTRVATENVNGVMGCEDVVEYSTPIRACAFVQGSTIGVFGVNRPAPGVEPLIGEVRQAIAGS